MRLPIMVLVMALAIATDIAYRPLWNLGAATIDPPLIVVLWFALRDRRPRVHLLILALVAIRTTFGIENLLGAWIPLALGAELTRFLGNRLDLRASYFRYPTLAVIIGATILISGLMAFTPVSTAVYDAGIGGVFASMFAVILFPILDALRPLLRSADFQM